MFLLPELCIPVPESRHNCPLSAHINQKHLVHDVLEQPSRLSPVSFSISGEGSTRTNQGLAGEKEKERQSMVKHI